LENKKEIKASPTIHVGKYKINTKYFKSLCSKFNLFQDEQFAGISKLFSHGGTYN